MDEKLTLKAKEQKLCKRPKRGCFCPLKMLEGPFYSRNFYESCINAKYVPSRWFLKHLWLKAGLEGKRAEDWQLSEKRLFLFDFELPKNCLMRTLLQLPAIQSYICAPVSYQFVLQARKNIWKATRQKMLKSA